MKKVCKYLLHHGVTTHSLPCGSIPRHFAIQRGNFCVWCEIDDDEPLNSPVLFTIVATGEETRSNRDQYVGTVHDGDECVWHLFYRVDD